MSCPPCRSPRLAWLLLAASLALGGGAAQAQQQQPITADWRVCLPDLVAPPYLGEDASRPGIVERLLVDGGRRAGLSVQLRRSPARRCVSELESGEADASVAASFADNLARYRFPQREGALDVSRRLARINMVWIKRVDSVADWDGQRLTGLDGPPVVGTRLGMRFAAEALRVLGLTPDDAALSTRQLLAKLQARRIDLAVSLQYDAEYELRQPEFAGLVMLGKPLQVTSFYPVLRRLPSPAQLARAEAWWSEIARLRELPAYQPPPVEGQSGRGASSTR